MVVVYIGHMFFFVVCRSSKFSLVAVDIFRQSANVASGAGGAGAVTGPGLACATWPVSGRPLRHVVSRRDGEGLHRPVLRRNAAHSEKAPTTLLD
jgi:hypothetical protein